MLLLFAGGAGSGDISLSADQTIPDFTSTAFLLDSVISLSASQTIPAFSQAANLFNDVTVGLSASQTIPAFTQIATLLRGDTTPGLIFNGQIGQVTINKRGLATFEVRGPMTLGRGIVTEHFSQACRADLYDTRCTISAASFAVSVTVATVIDAQTFTVVAATNPTGWFDLGPGKTAANDPFQIKTWTLSTLTVTTMGAIDLIIFAGDVLTIYAGCNKGTNCKDKFANKINYQGEEFAPGRDLQLTTAT